MKNKEVTIKKGETVSLGDGAKVKFIGHTHRRTIAGGPPSPLVILLEYLVNDQPEEATYNFYAKSYSSESAAFPSFNKNTGWKWHEYLFELIDYEYDKNMRLKIIVDPKSELPDRLL